MSARIVLFGATGYTGENTARALVARGLRPVLSARSQGPLEELAAELGGLETALADVSRPETVRALVGRGDVLLSTVGPFVKFGEPAVEAAIDAGALYIDSTGESSFIRRIFEQYSSPAERAGTTLLTAFGYDWVPGNLAGELALSEAAGAAEKLEIGYFTNSGMSGGTRASGVGSALDRAHSFRDGSLRIEPAGAHVRSFELPGGERAAGVSVGGSEQLALVAAHRQLAEVGVFLGLQGSNSKLTQALIHTLPPLARAGGVVTGVPAINRRLRAFADKRVKGSTGGPSESSRAKSLSTVIARAFGADNQLLSEVTLSGGSPYTFTFEILAWGAEQLAAAPPQRAGALGPAQAFSLEALEDGVARAGLKRV